MDDVAKLITDDSFISDCCRFSEGILSEAAVKHRWRKVVSETDWATMGSNDELVEAIEREKIRRMRNGQTAREKAQLHAVKAPDILNRIMTADESISPRHKIEASREIRAIAATGQDAIPTSERFIITINLGEDRLLIDKPIACGRLDDNGNIIDDTAPSELLAIASKREDGNSGEPL